ncbi:MAG: hypothetical protein K0V04_14265 [Deltaproteobacteria bacterium]|nr:hypothetical protein [Deltaproteobacteria bacterium]
MLRPALWMGALAGASAAWACGPEPTVVTSGGSDSGASSTGASETAGSSDGVDSTGAAETTGMGPVQTCTPGETMPCYDGPARLVGVGACVAGQYVCQPDGQTWSECEGQVLPQPEQCTTLADDDCDTTIWCEPGVAWSWEVDGEITAIATDASGNVFVAGSGSASAVIGDQSLADLFVVSFDPQGQFRWGHNIEEFNDQAITELAVDAQGSVTVTGTYQSTPDFGDGPLPVAVGTEVFLVRYDNDGVIQWSRGIDHHAAVDLAVAPEGSIYISGGFIDADIDGAPVVGDYFVAGFDPQGSLAWAHAGQGFSAQPPRVAVSASGTVVLAMQSGFGMVGLGGVELPLSRPGFLAWSLEPDGTNIAPSFLGAQSFVANLVALIPNPTGLQLLASLQVQLSPYVFLSSMVRLYMSETLEPVGVQETGTALFVTDGAPLPNGHTVIAGTWWEPLELGSTTLDNEGRGSSPLLFVVDEDGEGRWALRGPGGIGDGFDHVATDPTGSVFVSGRAGSGFEIGGRQVQGSFLLGLVP